jgi:prepilin-type N-terminal cleavage/methylation domain-containing protein
MNKKFNKGFTLIELLVVIAIIGILSAVVLTNLNSARDKAKVASVKTMMAQLKRSAEVYYYDNANSYNGFCGNTSYDSGGLRILSAIATSSPAAANISGVRVDAPNNGPWVTCIDNATDWGAQVRLDSTFTQVWCADDEKIGLMSAPALFDTTRLSC